MVRINSNIENSHKKYNYRNEFHFRTTLHFAARWGRIEVTKVLVDLGANVNAADNDGKTPYDIAVENHFISGTDEVAECLKELTQSE